MPVAHNLQSQGYIVIVPDITIYPIVSIHITNINKTKTLRDLAIL